MSISVIIPAYNAAQDVPGCLASIAAQTLPPAEILICDDGSTDATLTLLGSYNGQVPGPHGPIPLHVFSQKNQGAGAARNRCLAAATGTYIAFLDTDDRWHPTKLARSLEELEKGQYTFVAHNFEAVAPDGTHTLWDCVASAHRPTWPARDVQTHYFYRGFIGILTVVIRRDALMAVGGFDATHRYMLDWECWHAVLTTVPGATFGLFPDVLATYALNPGGLTAKGMARVPDRETFIARYVRPVARKGGIAWPLLLLRAWLTLMAETAAPLVKRKDWKTLARLTAYAPVSLSKVTIATLRNNAPRAP